MLTDPGTVVLLLLLIATLLIWLRPRAGKWLLAITVAFCFIISTLPVGRVMIAVLEDRFPIITSITEPVDGIIVLGGSVDQYLGQTRKQIILNNAAERLTSFVALARQFPKAKLVFTGAQAAWIKPIKKQIPPGSFLPQWGFHNHASSLKIDREIHSKTGSSHIAS